MALRHGRLAYISVDGTDLSAYFNGYSYDVEVDNSDTTTFGAAHRSNIAGLIGATVSADGFYDPTATTGPIAVINAAITKCQNGTPVAVVLREGGTGTGQYQESFNANITGFGRNPTMDGAVALSLAMSSTGSITNGTQ